MIDLTQYKELMKCKKQMKKIEKECDKQFRKEFRENPNLSSERYDELYLPYTKFKQEIYTSMLFKIFVELNPVVVEHRTGERLKFSEVFGTDFETINENVKMQIYMMAEESSVVYKFDEDLKNTKEDITVGGDFYFKEQLGFENDIFRKGQIETYGYMCGLPKKKWFSISSDEKTNFRKMFLAKSQREQARYMNENYGMNYNLNDFPDDEK